MKPYAEAYLPEAQGHRVHWAEYGNPDGPPLLMVHGSSNYTFRMEEFSALEGSDARVIVPHQRGNGNSLPRGLAVENTISRNVEDIERLRTYLNLKEWNVFAWSFGNVFAAAHAQQHPGTTLSLTSYGPYFGSNEDYMGLFDIDATTADRYFAHHKASTGYDIVRSSLAAESGGFEDKYRSWANTQRLYDSCFDSEKAIKSRSHSEWNELFQTRLIDAQMDYELFTKHDRFLEIGAGKAGSPSFPVNLIYGAEDAWVLPNSYAFAVFPDARTTIVPGAKHDVHDTLAQEALKPIFQSLPSSRPENKALELQRNPGSRLNASHTP